MQSKTTKLEGRVKKIMLPKWLTSEQLQVLARDDDAPNITAQIEPAVSMFLFTERRGSRLLVIPYVPRPDRSEARLTLWLPASRMEGRQKVEIERCKK